VTVYIVFGLDQEADGEDELFFRWVKVEANSIEEAVNKTRGKLVQSKWTFPFPVELKTLVESEIEA